MLRRSWPGIRRSIPHGALLLGTALAVAFAAHGPPTWGEGKDPATRAARLAAKAGALADSERPEDQARAVTLYLEALGLYRQAGDRAGQADCHYELAWLLDDASTAREHAATALELREEIDDTLNRAESHYQLGWLARGEAGGDRAWDHFKEALRLFVEAGDRHGEAEAHERLGRTCREYRDDLPCAVDHYRPALDLFVELGDEEEEASVLNNFGRVYILLDDLGEAETLLQRARAASRRSGFRGSEAAAEGNLALVARYRGDAQQALDFFERSRAIYEQLGDKRNFAATLNNRGRYYLALGDYEQAIDDLRRAVDLANEVGSQRIPVAALTALGRAHLRRGEPEEALAVLEHALELRRARDSDRGTAATFLALAQVYESQGRGAAALGAAREARALFDNVDAPRSQADTSVVIARLREEAAPVAAMADLRDALATYEEIGDPEGAIEARMAMARIERARGGLDRAQRLVALALEGIERQRARAPGHGLRSTYLAARHDAYGFAIDLLMARHRAAPDAGHDRAALELAERARARSLLDLLAESGHDLRAGAPAVLVVRERVLAERITAIDRERLDLADADADADRLESVKLRLGEVVREHEVVRSQIRAESPRLAAITEPEILDSEAIQHQLDPGTLLLVYHLGAERSVLWAVTNTTIEAHELPPSSKVEAAARSAHGHLPKSQQARQRQWSARALAELARMVLAPVAGALEEAERVLIAPAGGLHLVPFAALPAPAVPGKAAEVLLGEDREVVRVPSISALAMLRARREGREAPDDRIAVFADPVYGLDDPRFGADAALPSASGARLERLPFAGEEAAAILELMGPDRVLDLRGFDATAEAAKGAEVGQCRYVHFGTHAETNSRHPALSRLILAQRDPDGREREGSLYGHQLFDLDLAADLVVLSACDTGGGKTVRGEGLVGLTQGFLHAGAARVLVSLWPVQDLATADLMKRFYRHLLQEGASPAAALHHAQREMRESGRAAPYYWAGFVLVGEWR